MDSKKELEKIFQDIKDIKIQGATNIAKASVKAYSLSPTKATIKKLISLRPTEPMLQNVLDKLDKSEEKNKIINHFSEAQEEINKVVVKLIKSNYVIYTHCHSTNVVKALIYAKQNGKNFEVYNTETHPLFQGRKTAKELSDAGIKVTTFADSAFSVVLLKSQGTRKVSIIFLGADALLKNGDVINKVGSGTIAQIAKINKIPLYVVADSWKFSKKNLELEQRNYKEVWDNDVPKRVKIRNPAFEKIPAKHITGIVSELGILKPKNFVKKLSQ